MNMFLYLLRVYLRNPNNFLRQPPFLSKIPVLGII
jgi:hypothetical protein